MKLDKQTLDGWLANPQNKQKIIIYTKDDAPPPTEGQIVLPTDTDGNYIPGILPQLIQKVVNKTDDGNAIVYLRTLPIGEPVLSDPPSWFMANCTDDEDVSIQVFWSANKDEYDHTVRTGSDPAWFVTHVPLPKGLPSSVIHSISSEIAEQILKSEDPKLDAYVKDRLTVSLSFSHLFKEEKTIQKVKADVETVKRIISGQVTQVCNAECPKSCNCHNCEHFVNKPKPSVF